MPPLDYIDYKDLYAHTTDLLSNSAIHKVLEASYKGVYLDEY